MAEKIALDLLINTSDSAKSVGELKKSIKDLNTAALQVGEGSEEFVKLSIAASKAKDKLQDINENLRALNPENLGASFVRLGSNIANGFAAAQGAMVLLGNSGKDFEQTLIKIQAATAFAQGLANLKELRRDFELLKFSVLGVIENFKQTEIGIKLVAAAQRVWNVVAAANPIALIIAGAAALTAGIYALSKAFHDNQTDSEKLIESNNKLIQSYKDTTEQIDIQIISLTGLKANEKDIIKLQREKLELNIAQKKLLLENAKENQKAVLNEKSLLDDIIGGLGFQSYVIEKGVEKYAEAGEKIKEIDLDLAKAEAEAKRDSNIQTQKDLDQAEAAEKERLEKLRKIKEEEIRLQKEYDNILDQAISEATNKRDANEAKAREEKRKAILDEQANMDALLSDFIANEKAKADEQTAIANRKKEALLSIEQSIYSTLSSIGELFIQNSKNLEKFKRGEALFQIAVDTAKAISSLTAASSANPLNAVTGGVAGIAQYASGIARILANVARAKQILSSGSVSGTSAGSSGTGGGVNVSGGFLAPQINPVGNTSTVLNSNSIDNGNGKVNPIKAYVVETDLTKVQNGANSLKKKSIIG